MHGYTNLAVRLRSTRSAAIAGIAFGLTLGIVIVLLRSSVTHFTDDPSTWLNVPSARGTVTLATNLIPFAGIAFLWFIGVVRTRLGDREDRLFATVFLGSGLLFVATLFVASAAIESLLVLRAHGQATSADTQRFVGAFAGTMMGAFGARMAAVFTLTVTTLGRRTRLIPPWLATLGYAAAITLLLTPPISGWSQLLFPGWVLILSCHLLYVSLRDVENSDTTVKA